jgi:hypothetical protein
LLFNTVFDFDYKNKVVTIDFSEELLTADIIPWTKNELKGGELLHETKEGFVFKHEFTDDALTEDNFIDITGRTNVGTFDCAEDLPEPEIVDQIALVLNDNNYYAVKSIEDVLTWQRLSDNYFAFDYDPENTLNRKEIMPKIAPMLMRYKTFTLPSASVLIPAIEHVGSSTAFDIGINNFPMRTMLWHGLQDDSNGDDYPFASSYNRDYAGNVIGNLTLRWDDEDYGLFETFWKRWARFWYYKEKMFQPLDLEEADVQNYSHKKRYRIRNFIFLVLDLKVMYEGQVISKSGADIYKINA